MNPDSPAPGREFCRDRLLADFLELIQIPSVSGSEELVRQVLLLKLSDLGLKVKTDEAGNLFARLPGDPGLPPSAFSAHLDTVPSEPVRYRIDGEWIHSTGESILAADDRAGIAALLEGVRRLQEGATQHGEVEMIFTVEEEIGLRGAKAFDLEWVRSPFILVLDHGGPPARVVRGAPSLEKLRFRFQGLAAHAGTEPEKGVSAVRALALAISRMSLGRIDEETTANIGRIKGGDADNVIPERAEMSGEARSHDRGKLEAQVTEMIQAAQCAAKEVGAEVIFDRQRDFEGYCLPDDDPLLELVGEAALASSLTFALTKAGGASDANIFNARGKKSAVLCCGYYGPHTRQEKASLSQMEDLTRWLVAIMRQR